MGWVGWHTISIVCNQLQCCIQWTWMLAQGSIHQSQIQLCRCSYKQRKTRFSFGSHLTTVPITPPRSKSPRYSRWFPNVSHHHMQHPYIANTIEEQCCIQANCRNARLQLSKYKFCWWKRSASTERGNDLAVTNSKGAFKFSGLHLRGVIFKRQKTLVSTNHVFS